MARKKPPTPPDPDDPTLARTCNRCGHVRRWVDPVCPCGCPEYSLPDPTNPTKEPAQ